MPTSAPKDGFLHWADVGIGPYEEKAYDYHW